VTKSEAIKSMEDGHKVSHHYFSDNEWMTMENGYVVTEDGYRHDPELFWHFRKGESWKDGYKFVFSK